MALITRPYLQFDIMGPRGGIIKSNLVPGLLLTVPNGGLVKDIKVGLQIQNVDPELIAKVTNDTIVSSPVVTINPKRRKFHKPVVILIPFPKNPISRPGVAAPRVHVLFCTARMYFVKINIIVQELQYTCTCSINVN